MTYPGYDWAVTSTQDWKTGWYGRPPQGPYAWARYRANASARGYAESLDAARTIARAGDCDYRGCPQPRMPGGCSCDEHHALAVKHATEDDR